MIEGSNISGDRIAVLAERLKRDLLSADEFGRELKSLTRQERAALAEFLDRMPQPKPERPAPIRPRALRLPDRLPMT